MKTKKATTKRQRKYGKKVEDYPERAPDEKVKLMVDGYTVMTFKNKQAANAYIEKKNKESAAKRKRPTSFIFL